MSGLGGREGSGRRRPAAALLLLLPLVWIAACGEERPADAGGAFAPVAWDGPPPNLLLISLDTTRADRLPMYGYERDTAPHLAELAAQGVVFEQAISESSWTLPTHATLFTGLSSGVHGVTDDRYRLGPDHVTLAQILKRAGYRTEAAVSAPYVHPVFGFGRGFDRYEVLLDTIYDEPGYAPDRGRGDRAWRERERTLDQASHRTRTSGRLADFGVEALARLAGSGPFFLFLHFFDPHSDYQPPESHWRPFNPDYAGGWDFSNFYFRKDLDADLPPAAQRQLRALYDGEIHWTDAQVGRVLDALDARGLAENTLVAVVSDHGEEFFEHGGKVHRFTLFDEQLRVPWILRLPGRLPAGGRVGMQVRLIDVLPTLLDLLGQPRTQPSMGRSLVGVARGAEPERDLPALSLLVWPQRYTLRSLRRSEGKLLVHERPDGTTQSIYFDLVRDPGEQQPIQQGRALEEARAELRNLLAAERALRDRLEARAAEVEIPEAMQEALEDLGYVWPEETPPAE